MRTTSTNGAVCWLMGYVADQAGLPAPSNKAQAQAFQQGFHAAFPDLHFDIMQIIAEGDYVVVNWRGSGTHQGPMRTV